MNVVDGLHAFIWRDVTANNCNTYFIDGPKKIIIDPGHRRLFGHVRKGLSDLGYSLEDIDVVIITHGHPDHLEAVQSFEGSAMVVMSQEEYDFIERAMGSYFAIPQPEFFLREGDFAIGDHNFRIISTPGHSPGSISIYWDDINALFSGDVVFKQSIGRTDLPGGRGLVLKESIVKLAKLDVEYLLPGHGEIVSGREEVRNNFQLIEQTWFNYLR